MIESSKLISEEILRNAVGGSNDGIWDWNLETEEVFYSDRCAEILGFEKGETKKDFSFFKSLIHPDDVEEVFNEMYNHIEKNTPIYSKEYRICKKSGQIIWILEKGKAIRDENGKAIRFAGFISDITDRKVLEQKLIEEKELNQSIFENVPAITFLWDEDGKIIKFNKYAQEKTGHSEEDVLGKRWVDILIPGDISQYMDEVYEEIKNEKLIQDHENSIICKDGNRLDILWRNKLISVREGKKIYISMGLDITERHRAERELQNNYEELSAVYEELAASEEELRQQFDELQQNQEALRKSEERYKIAVDGANDGIWDWDLERDISYISYKWSQMLGLDNTEVSNHYKIWSSLIHKDDIKKVEKSLKEHFDGLTDYYESEYRLKKKNNGYIWVLSRGKAIKDNNGKLLRMAGSHTDITERKRTEEIIYNMAYYDSLTGLPNRTNFHQRVNEELINSVKYNSKGALFYLDIDNFKEINDTLGHSFGDVFLIKVAERLYKYVNNNTFVARFGGDEFIILLSGATSNDEIVAFANMLIKEFSQSWNINGHELFPTISVGITRYPMDGKSIKDLIKNSDMAMYRAKELGKNNYQFYKPSMLQQISERIEMEKNLRRAMQNNEFIIHYQPIINIDERKIVGMEALIRWNHPTKGIIQPKEFISLAEETGLIKDVGKWVFETASKEVKLLHDMGFKGLTVSINTSSIQLKYIGFVDDIRDILNKTGLAPQYLQVEITESHMIDNFNVNNIILRELRKLGIKISLDDFGTGYSSLNYLKELPISTLKIDKSFIEGFECDASKIIIIETIIGLAHKLGMDVIAEGVETVEQMECLKSLKCDSIQGYLLGHPVPISRLTEMLNTRTGL